MSSDGRVPAVSEQFPPGSQNDDGDIGRRCVMIKWLCRLITGAFRLDKPFVRMLVYVGASRRQPHLKASSPVRKPGIFHTFGSKTISKVITPPRMVSFFMLGFVAVLEPKMRGHRLNYSCRL
jgi:hypothetical protein